MPGENQILNKILTGLVLKLLLFMYIFDIYFGLLKANYLANFVLTLNPLQWKWSPPCTPVSTSGTPGHQSETELDMKVYHESKKVATRSTQGSRKTEDSLSVN